MTKAPDGVDTGWGSHQPALHAFAKFREIKSVIEFGAGAFSTHLFLDREVFPDLKALVTFEHKGNWASQVWVDDARLTLIITAPSNFKELSTNAKADFVFLDCAPLDTRNELIPHVLSLAPIFAVHDCVPKDLSEYGFKYVKGANSKIQTVFASNTVDLGGLGL